MPADRGRRLRQPHRNSRSAHAAGDRVVALRDQAKVPHDGIGEDLPEVVDRADGHVRFAELTDDLPFRDRPDPRFEEWNERGAVLHATAVVGEPRVVQELDRKSTRLNSSHTVISY